MTTIFSTYETMDEFLLAEIENEALYRGLESIWGQHYEKRGLWIDINCTEQELGVIVRNAKRLVARKQRIEKNRLALGR